MPVRQLTSSVLKWPDAQTVHQALRHWTEGLVRERKDVLRIGCFGSCARGDLGEGSDLDLVIIVKSSARPFHRGEIDGGEGSNRMPGVVVLDPQGSRVHS